MATIPREYIDNFTKVINAASADAQSRLVKALEVVSVDDIAAARDEIIAIMDTILSPYTDNVAAIAAEFYDGLRAWAGVSDGFIAEAESNRNQEATDGAVRAFMQTQVDGKPFSVLQTLLAERVDYEIKRAANECVAYNCKRDPKKPKWARVPSGIDTCDFCIMLASRGFAYQSEETASHAHANCDCRIVPSWSRGTKVQGYDPDALYDQWVDSGFKPSSGSGSSGGGKTPARMLGNNSKFGDVHDMTAYLESSKNLDELYKRADEVLKDINKNWDGSKSMFNSASRAAKEMRNKLSA